MAAVPMKLPTLIWSILMGSTSMTGIFSTMVSTMVSPLRSLRVRVLPSIFSMVPRRRCVGAAGGGVWARLRVVALKAASAISVRLCMVFPRL